MSDWQRERYEESVGREPGALPDDHPERWQWEYRGTPAERANLLRELGLEMPTAAPTQIEGQGELFG